MQIVHGPTLPPKLGYVEVIDIDGNYVYQPTPEQQEKDQQQALIQKLQTENAALSEQSVQSDEAALTLLESQGALEDAIIALLEMIEGGTTA